MQLLYFISDTLIASIQPSNGRRVCPIEGLKWLDDLHITEGHLLYLKSSDLNVNLILKTPSQKHSE